MYPTISEYLEAIKSAEDNLDQLKHLRPVLGADGEPIFSSGNFAVVFKMKDEKTGKLHAVKCFLREQEGRAEAYRQIAEELEYVSSTFLTPIKYLDDELFVDTSNSDESEFPVLLMDWVDGDTLDKYVINNKYDGFKLSRLFFCFYELSMWLLSQPFAHGDLKPDNIIVKNDGNLVLIDYDGMYVPEMYGQKPREQGSPNYRIYRDNNQGSHIFFNSFSKRIDDFAIIHILLSLRVYSIYPHLIKENEDFAVFNEAEFQNLQGTHIFQEILSQNIDLKTSILFTFFQKTISNGFINYNDWKILHFENPQNNCLNMEMQMCSLDNIVLAVELAYSSMQFRDPARNEYSTRDYSEKSSRIILATEIQEDLKNHEWNPLFNGIKYSRFKSNGIEKREGVVYDLRTYALRYLFGVVKYQTIKDIIPEFVFGGGTNVFSTNFDENKYELYLEEFVKVQEQCAQQYRYLYVFDIRDFFKSVKYSVLKDIYWGNEFCNTEWFDVLYNYVFDPKIISGLNPCSEIDFFFANLYLKSLDDRLSQYEGIKYYRYCDDIRIFSNAPNLMENLKLIISAILRPLGLVINTDKTKLIDTNKDKIELSKACFIYSNRLYIGANDDYSYLLKGKSLAEIIKNDLTTSYISKLLKSLNDTVYEEDGSLEEHLNNLFFILKNVHKNASLYRTISTLVFERGIERAQNMLVFSDILKRTVDLLYDDNVEPFVKYWVLRTFFCTHKRYYKTFMKEEEPWKSQAYYTRPSYMEQIADLLNDKFNKPSGDKLLYHISNYIINIIDPFDMKADELPF